MSDYGKVTIDRSVLVAALTAQLPFSRRTCSYCSAVKLRHTATNTGKCVILFIPNIDYDTIFVP